MQKLEKHGMMSIKYRHKKTGNIYWATGTATNATNDSEGQEMTIYQNMDGELFVRLTSEFEQKFELAES
jgi:hypothetical protein